jgi:isopenicillin N synthase-like dioxygenase
MITLLATDGVAGLQVCRDKDKEPKVWEDVAGIKGTFVVNIGDLMERWTNGLFRYRKKYSLLLVYISYIR